MEIKEDFSLVILNIRTSNLMLRNHFEENGYDFNENVNEHGSQYSKWILLRIFETVFSILLSNPWKMQETNNTHIIVKHLIQIH